MRLIQWYKNQDENRRNILLLTSLALIVFLCLVPFFFFSQPGVPLGWLLGSVIEIAAYASIAFGASVMFDQDNPNKTRGFLSIAFGSVRLLVYGAGLVAGALLTFKYNEPVIWLNFWTVFAGYMPMNIVLLVVSYRRVKRKKA